MARRGAWMLVLLLAASLAGCVAEDGRPRGRQPPEIRECDEALFSPPVERDCCWDCPAPYPPYPRPVPSECPNVTYAVTFAPAVELCAVPAPPLFEPFVEVALRDCVACSEVAVATWGERIFVATEEGLDVVSPATRASIAPPALSPPGVTYVPDLRSPSVAVLGRDVWYAALSGMPLGGARVESLLVARWDGTSGWASEDAVAVGDAPGLGVVDRVQLVPTSSGVVALLTSAGRAWSLDVQAPVARPEPFAGPEMHVRVGKPAMDADGRAFVPYVARLELGGPPTLRFAVLVDPWSAWSHHAGPEAVGGIAEGTTPALEVRPDGALALSWADAEGDLSRAVSEDGGMTWSAPETWSAAAGTPTTPRAAHDLEATTLAWSDQEHVLLARSHPVRGFGWHDMSLGTRGEPDLALRQGKAVVAWLAPERGLVLALEGEEVGTCGAGAHCAQRWPEHA